MKYAEHLPNEIRTSSAQSRKRNPNFNMHLLTNNIFNLPGYEPISTLKSQKNKQSLNIKKYDRESPVPASTKENQIYLSTPKDKNKLVLPPIEDKSTTNESDHKSSVINNYDLFIKNKQLLEKDGHSPNLYTPVYLQTETPQIKKRLAQLSNSLDPGKLRAENDGTNIELISNSPSSQFGKKKFQYEGEKQLLPINLKKPPLPPRAVSSGVSSKKPPLNLNLKVAEPHFKDEPVQTDYNDPNERDKDLNKLHLQTEYDVVSNHSNSSSVTKDKNYYDLNRNLFREKLLRSLDVQSRNQDLFVNKILKEESRRNQVVEEYIDKSISIRREKEKLEENLKKIKRDINYFKIIDKQLEEKKKKLEIDISNKKFMREVIDRECFEDQMAENSLKEKERLIKRNYREFLDHQISTNKNIKILKKTGKIVN